MNCRPGDLAVCIRPGRKTAPVSPLGRFCTVLHAAPRGSFRLPDGELQIDLESDSYWVVEWQQEIAYPMIINGKPDGWRWTRFGTAPDYALRPIRPQADDAVDESLAYLPPVPTKNTETV
jgi:hypothetical protein